MTPAGAWLSPAQAATQLGVPRQRVLTAIRTRDLPAINLGRPHGRPYYRINPDDLTAYIQARRTVDTTAPRGAH